MTQELTRRSALFQFANLAFAATAAIKMTSSKSAEAKRPAVKTSPPKLRAPQPRVHPVHKHHVHHRTHHRPHALRAIRTLDTPGNRRDLALTMWGEARGYGALGMRAIGHVVMNRVASDKHATGHGVHGVCHKRKQFSCWNRGDPNRLRMHDLPELNDGNPDWEAWLIADRLAGRILAGIDKDNTGGATYYHAENMTPYWRDDMQVVGVMFGHIFYKPKKKHHHRHHHSH